MAGSCANLLLSTDRRCQGDLITTLCVAAKLMDLQNVCEAKSFSSSAISRLDHLQTTDEVLSRKTVIVNE
jgi:hypothetical protein